MSSKVLVSLDKSASYLAEGVPLSKAGSYSAEGKEIAIITKNHGVNDTWLTVFGPVGLGPNGLWSKSCY